MRIYLHDSLCDLSKASPGSAATPKKSGGQHEGAKYYRREVDKQNPYKPDGSVNYVYYDTASDWEAHQREMKDRRDKEKEHDSGKDLEGKVHREHERHIKEQEKKTRPSLFIGKKKESAKA